MDKRAKDIIAFFKNNPGQFFSASEINKALGISPEDDQHVWGTHGILLELSKAGVVAQTKGHGFMYVAFENRKVG